MKKLCLILILSINFVFSQDPVFTQFYNIPESMNPAFAGGGGGSEIGVLNRTQWPGLDYSLNSQFFYFDNYIESYNSGLELTILNQVETVTRFNYTQIGLNYSYRVQLNNEWFFYPGLSVGFGNKDYAFNNLVLEDQILINSGIINFDSKDPFLLNESKSILDIGAGFIIFNENIWFGGSFKHLNTPNISFEPEGDVKLKPFISIHGGYKLPLNQRFSRSDINLYFNFNYMNQNDYDRLDVGSKFQINDFTIGAFGTLAPTSVQNDSHKPVSYTHLTLPTKA